VGDFPRQNHNCKPTILRSSHIQNSILPSFWLTTLLQVCTDCHRRADASEKERGVFEDSQNRKQRSAGEFLLDVE